MVSNSNEEDAGFGNRTAVSLSIQLEEWKYGAEIVLF